MLKSITISLFISVMSLMECKISQFPCSGCDGPTDCKDTVRVIEITKFSSMASLTRTDLSKKVMLSYVCIFMRLTFNIKLFCMACINTLSLFISHYLGHYHVLQSCMCGTVSKRTLDYCTGGYRFEPRHAQDIIIMCYTLFISQQPMKVHLPSCLFM